jgi:OmcA/MtrC family decaheme c-type cytochrome
MTRTKLSTHGWAAALAFALFGVGCAGSDGSQGPQGPQGTQGPAGPQIVATSEACRGCHGQFAASHGLAEYDAVTVTMDPAWPVSVTGTDIVLKFNVKVAGLNRDDLTWKAAFSASRVHVEDAWWVYDVTTLAGQRKKLDNTALADRTGMWSFVGTGNGNYVATLDATMLGTVARWDGSIARPTDPGTGFMVSIKNSAGAVATAVAFLAGQTHDAVSDQACVNCHGNHVWREFPEASGADHFEVLRPQGVTPCLFCHNRQGAGDVRMAGAGVGLMSLVHGVHNSKNMPGGGYQPYWSPGFLATISVGFPGYLNNCSTCHDSAARLAQVTGAPMSWDLCTSCHGTAKFGTAPASHSAFNKATACTTCHGAGATVDDFHNGLKTERAGLIWNGADQSVVQGERIAMSIDAVSYDPGSPGTIVVTWSAKLDGVAVNPCNTTVSSTAPVFHRASANAATGAVAQNMSILKAYAQGNDWVNGIPGVASPGQPASVNLSSTNTSCAGNVATTRVPADAITASSTQAIVALQGKPQLRFDPAIATSFEVIQVRAQTPTREFVPASGAAPATPRRQIVSIDKCSACHLGSMYQHGGNRVDKIELCDMCHNPASTEQQNRVAWGVTAAEAYDGKVGQTYDMRTMVHAIHSAGETGNPLVYYRSNGVYFFGSKAALAAVPSWPTTGGVTCPNSEGATVTYYPVAGSVAGPNDKVPVITNGVCDTSGGPASTVGVYRVHNFIEVHYPRALNDCAACHVGGTERSLPDPKEAVAVTVDMGGGTASNLLDDVVKGPAAASCMSCHQYGNATLKFQLNEHAFDNGWWPSAFPNGRQTLLDAAP